jgi:hypothetical protein
MKALEGQKMAGQTETAFAALVAAQCDRVAPSIPSDERAADVARIVALSAQLPNSRNDLNPLLAAYGGMVALRLDSARRARSALYWRSGWVEIFLPTDANAPRSIPRNEAKRLMFAA